MNTVHHSKEEIKLPDFYDINEVSSFVNQLSQQISRYGIKKLHFCSKQILTHLQHIEKHIATAEGVVSVVNGQPTKAQRIGYAERTLRTGAVKFYTSLTETTLRGYCDYNGVNRGDMTRQEMEDALIELHVAREIKNGWCDVVRVSEDE